MNINDLTSFETDVYSYKKYIDILNTKYKKLQSDYNNLSERHQLLSLDFDEVVNSRGWLLLNKIRKFLPQKKSNIIKSESTTIEQKPVFFYRSHYEKNKIFNKKYTTDIKALAFYLPQYHTFKENDCWWGEGFTEWTNTKKAKPRFDGHYQPREPHDDIGYYTLDNKMTIAKQVELAKQHGLYGFCFYYYWFSGKELMTKPIDIFLNNEDIVFPFCLCWANENWTRRWDGADEDILIAQKYSKKDPVNFIHDIKKYLLDPRYIRIDNKPVILVYKPEDIPNFEQVVQKWRSTATEEGIGDILIWCRGFMEQKNYTRLDSIDAEFDFAPHPYIKSDFLISHTPSNDIYSYKKLIQTLSKNQEYVTHFSAKPFYYSCMLGWDNSARRSKNCVTFAEYSPKYFYNWLRILIEETRKRNPIDNRFIFVNAWNEWGEGTYLEPDKKYGYTNINTFSKAIYDLKYEEDV